MSTFPTENSGKELLPTSSTALEGGGFPLQAGLPPVSRWTPVLSCNQWLLRPVGTPLPVGRLGAEILRVLLMGASTWCSF